MSNEQITAVDMVNDEKDHVDSMLPKWIEFIKLDSPEQIKHAVKIFFSSDSATSADFENAFGIRLQDFIGFYLEIAVAETPSGPLMPAPVSPILVLKQSKSGTSFTPHILKYDGMINVERRLAWVDAVEWEKFVHDTFREEVKERAKEILEAQKAAARELAKEMAKMVDQNDGKG